MTIRRIALFSALAFLMAAPLLAEEAAQQPGPLPEHKELAMWVGTWAGTGELKASAYGPGGEMTWTDECNWGAGAEYHIVCKSKGEGAMGPTTGVGIMGYHPGKQVYTHYGFDSNGWSGYAEGTRTDNTYTFQSTEVMGGQTFQSRFSMTLVSPTEMTFSWETSPDGETWTVLMDGVSRKQ